MRSLLIVEAKPERQDASSFRAAGVGAGIGPFAQQRLDEALSLAVGTRPIGPGALVVHARAHARLAEAMRAVAGAIVGEQCLDRDASGCKPGAGPTHETGAATPRLVRQDLCVRDAGE